MPRRKADLPVSPAWLELLRAAVARVGVRETARGAGLSLSTVVRMQNGGAVNGANVATLRAFLAKRGAPLPPPVAPITSVELAGWIELGEKLIAKDRPAVAAALAKPAGIRAAVAAAKPGRRS